MQTVQLPDGTTLQFPDGMSQDEMRSAINRYLGQQAPEPQAEAERGPAASPLSERPRVPDFVGNAPAYSRAQARPELPEWYDDSQIGALGETIYENVVGRGEVDTPGERLGELIRGAGAATARGMADVPALPVNVAQLATAGVDYGLNQAGLLDGPSMASRALDALPDTRGMLEAVPVIGPESTYRAPGTLGEYVSTMGEFAGGAGLLAGPNAVMRYGVLPGAASEAAGQMTEGSSLEPWARAGAALAAPFAAGRMVSPFGGADPQMLEAARRARELGITPSAGQTVGSTALQTIEGTLTPTASQLDDLAAATMRTVGSNAPRATPSALRRVETDLGNQFDDVLRGVTATPSPQAAARAMRVVDNYLQDAPALTATPRVRNVAQEIIDAATTPGAAPITLETFRRWRTALGSLTSSADEATRDAARGLRSVIDDVTDTALAAAGRTADIERLANLRRQWWNFIGIKDAASRAGQQTRLGRLTPENLRGAVSRTQGSTAISMGRGTDLADLAVTAETVIPTAPAVSAGGVRTFSPEMLAAGGGAAAGGIPGALAGASLVSGARAAINSPPLQAYLRNQLMAPTTMRGTAAMLPGILESLQQ